jgi:peptidyl-prolyl cis-trans isomerase B (cyclophilin B)
VIRLRRLALVLLPVVLVAGCGSSGSSGKTVTARPPKCSYPVRGHAATAVTVPPGNPPSSNPSTLVISTNDGDIPVTLEPDKAPCAVNSFVSLAQQGYFDNTRCLRLTTQGYYVLQCGDPSGTGNGGPGYSFADELVSNDHRLQPCASDGSVCTYNSGTIAMANAGPNTNGSQFFLVYGNSQFPPAYTVLGHMDAAGLAVVKAIAAKGIGTVGMGPGDGSPKDPVTITSVK